MTVAASGSKSKRKSRPSRIRVSLSPEKGRELTGLLLLASGLLLALALGSHHPGDPSLLRHVAGVDGAPRVAGVANWIGPLGAQISALAFALAGLTAFLLPLALLVGGARRIAGQGRSASLGRLFGLFVVLAALPALAALAFGNVPWRGGTVPAGGALGEVLAEVLVGRLHAAGAVVILLAAVAAGLTLLVQTTLGELVGGWMRTLRSGLERLSLARARWTERRHKERAKKRVVAKHLERAIEERKKREAESSPAKPVVTEAARSGEAPGSTPARVDLPLRVEEKEGPGGFSVRRVSAAEAETGAPAAEPRSAGRPQPVAAPAAKSKERGSPRQLPLAGGRASEGPLPPLNLLQLDATARSVDEAELVRRGEAIRDRCAEFGVEGDVVGINPGPVITVYEFQPAPGVKVSQIVNLQDDLALALKAESVRIDRLPGRSTLGIEVPNQKRQVIRLGALLSDSRFQSSPSKLTLALGETIQGEPYYADLATMPHLLVAGATGAGKSVGLQGMITSILYQAASDDVKFIFIDPKRIELGVYRDIPHLAAEVVVDPKKAANALQNMVLEMERRYRLLAEVHVRSIAFYNRAIEDPEVQKRLALNDDDDTDVREDDLKPLPYYVIVIDELADLMMVASSEVETAIARLAQMARAVGIHLIVATQRPSVDVLTGTIKANFPTRIAFATATRHDSRTILDQVGAEKLLGKGDMLIMPPGTSRVQRLHGAYVSEQETAALVRWLKRQGKPEYDPELLEAPEGGGGGGGAGADASDSDDELFEEAARLVVSEGQGSASFLQRRLRVGFSRASRLIDMMERDGILGPAQGSKPRDVLVKPDFFAELDQERMD